MRFKAIGSVAVMLAAMMLAGCDDEKDKQEVGPPVKVGAPIRKELVEWDEFTGRFQASERVEVRARVSGYLQELHFKDGEKVKEGDLLFTIDQRPYQIDLERAEASYVLAQKEFARAKRLQQSSAGTVQLVDQRQQELNEAKAAFDDAKLNLEFTQVKSPIDGRAGRHLVDVGNLVSGEDNGATLLTTVVATRPIDFYFEASEQELLKYIRLDQEGSRESSRTATRKMYVKLQDEKEFIHEGVIDFVDNEVDPDTGTIQGRATFENDDDVLLPGVFGRGRMAGSGRYNAMLVPDEVIGTNQTQKIVYVVNQKNVVEPRNVVLGPLHDGGLRIIREGLSDEDRVVMAGIMMVRPDMKVTPVPVDEKGNEILPDSKKGKE